MQPDDVTARPTGRRRSSARPPAPSTRAEQRAARRGHPLLHPGVQDAWAWPSDDLGTVCEWIPGASPAAVLREERAGHVSPLALAGEVDLDNRAETEFHLLQACESAGEGDVVVLDLGDLTFMDVAGSDALASLTRDLGSRGAIVVTRGARPMVRLVLQLTGLLGEDAVLAEPGRRA